jgi:hypothetical protein
MHRMTGTITSILVSMMTAITTDASECAVHDSVAADTAPRESIAPIVTLWVPSHPNDSAVTTRTMNGTPISIDDRTADAVNGTPICPPACRSSSHHR